jgi:alginate O-acetyltransferase complex protein AlgI
MNFNGIPFVVLFATTFALYYAPVGGQKWQLAVLIAASLVFYAWNQPGLLVLLLFSAGVTSLVSFALTREPRRWKRRLIATSGVAAMLSVLAFFKYDHLIYQTLTGTAPSSSANWIFLLPLPIGISFYTFHGISLVADTFGKNVSLAAIPSRGSYLARTFLYMTFFPQLIAGPIMKARDFFPQIGGKLLAEVNWEAAARNLVTGYFLKMVVADNLVVLTSAMTTSSVSLMPSLTLLCLIFAYSCQIFADFAGYSLIAIGLARLLGYELMTNFNFPYISQSFSEFWHRWHISLSTWLRDYLYIPLGGNRRGPIRTSLNIMVVMFLGGLWHGAAWSYAAWGTVHGAALVIERLFLGTRFYTSNLMWLRIVRTLIVLVVVSFAWLLFRLSDINSIHVYLAAMLSNWKILAGAEVVFALVAYSLPVALYHLASLALPASMSSTVRSWAYAAMLALIILNSGVPGAFIYFQF